MTANTLPIFTLAPVIGLVSISTANTHLDGTGTIGTVLTGGAEGTRIHKIIIQATVTTTAGMVRLYIHDGANYFLWREIPVSAITPSANVAAFTYTIGIIGELALVLPSGYSLRASTEKAETFKIIAEGGNY
jgi:phospholipase/lecithinase/hemolysin